MVCANPKLGSGSGHVYTTMGKVGGSLGTEVGRKREKTEAENGGHQKKPKTLSKNSRKGPETTLPTSYTLSDFLTAMTSGSVDVIIYGKTHVLDS